VTAADGEKKVPKQQLNILSFFVLEKNKKNVPVLYRTKATNTLPFFIIPHLYHYAKNVHKYFVDLTSKC
jgi:hypothetical protein